MKINVIPIIVNHLRTLHNSGSTDIAAMDIFIFFFLPLIVSLIVCYGGHYIDKDTFSASISVFSIFAALLFSVQVAIFGVLQRDWGRNEGNTLDLPDSDKIRHRRELLRELNTNISYLIIISCASVIIYLLLYSINEKSMIGTALSVWIFCHFILTLIMVIKRAYLIFDEEYSHDNALL